jgi:hypothetical protein
MKLRITALAVLFLFLAALAAGCTKPSDVSSQKPTVTQTTVPAPATQPPTTGAGTEPLQTPPPGYEVAFTLQKDRVYSTITLAFEGGPGQILVQKVRMRVTRSDGEVITGTMVFAHGSQIAKGDSLDMEGTHGPDRAEVFVTLAGVDYKIMEKTLGGQEFYQ